MSTFALSYHEPDIGTILTLSSFLLLLNIVNYALDRIVYCGLIGQILVGIAWGTPGANWLSADVQQAVMQLGYIGLILLVYEDELTAPYSASSCLLITSSQAAFRPTSRL